MEIVSILVQLCDIVLKTEQFKITVASSLVLSVDFHFTRFECSFNFTRFECSFNFTRFECSFFQVQAALHPTEEDVGIGGTIADVEDEDDILMFEDKLSPLR